MLGADPNPRPPIHNPKSNNPKSEIRNPQLRTPGTLYVVATPIGNLKDITLRALEVLERVDCIACEDTRVTSRLLQHYHLRKTLISYHEHNERQRADELVRRLLAGQSIALVADAGTPALSDPGAHLVSAAARNGITCIPIPGPSALSAILAVSGWEIDKVQFVGFPPSRTAQRQKYLQQFPGSGTFCFFESPHRVLSLIRQLEKIWNNPEIVLGRELTKVHEEVLRGSAQELAHTLANRDRLRGEFVLLVRKSEAAPVVNSHQSIREEFDRLLAAGEDRKGALHTLAARFGLSRKELYEALIKKERPGGPQNGGG
jgi:16S rRNA (cytidine1402-2'-O)-methyltransferase